VLANFKLFHKNLFHHLVLTIREIITSSATWDAFGDTTHRRAKPTMLR